MGPKGYGLDNANRAPESTLTWLIFSLILKSNRIETTILIALWTCLDGAWDRCIPSGIVETSRTHSIEKKFSFR